ncbi:MAG: hypothetical protein AAGB51_14250 [Planctomycetota bacterium]
MPSPRGQVSFCRLRVVGPETESVGSDELSLLSDHTLQTTDIGVPSETEFGWCGGEHVYDERFEQAKNSLLAGRVGWFGLRLDTNRVPAEIKRALRAQHERALLAESETGFLSRREKTELRELIDRANHDELATGKHRKSKLVPVLWDAPRKTLLSAAAGNTVVEALCNHWRQTFGMTGGSGALRPQSAGAVAADHLAASLGMRAFEDLRPSAFTKPPSSAGDEGTSTPVVPWAAASPEPHDFLGNEFLLWLWFRCETSEGLFPIELEGGEHTEVSLAFESTLETECAWGVTGKQTLKGAEDGPAPVRLREARDALQTGKWPRRAGLLLSDGIAHWRFTFQADRWLVSGCALPAPSEDAIPAPGREMLEYRASHALRLDALLVALFGSFLELRTGDRWATTRERMSGWIRGERTQIAVAQVAAPVEVIAAAGA